MTTEVRLPYFYGIKQGYREFLPGEKEYPLTLYTIKFLSPILKKEDEESHQKIIM